MGYDADYQAAGDSPFRARLKMALIAAAIAIQGEATTAKTVKDEKRGALADVVLNSMGEELLTRFALAAVVGGALTTASTDGQIDTRVAAIWNDMAGVRGSES